MRQRYRPIMEEVCTADGAILSGLGYTAIVPFLSMLEAFHAIEHGARVAGVRQFHGVDHLPVGIQSPNVARALTVLAHENDVEATLIVFEYTVLQGTLFGTPAIGGRIAEAPDNGKVVVLRREADLFLHHGNVSNIGAVGASAKETDHDEAKQHSGDESHANQAA